MVPFGSDPHRIVPEGVQLPPGTEAISAPVTTVSDGYFGTLDVPILEGREFQSTDGAESQRVAIVNEVFAKKYYPNRSAIGKRFRLDGPSGPLVEIVGVARQSKYVFAVEPPLDYVYLPLAQNPQPSGMSIMLETTGPSGSVAGSLRDLVRSLDAGQPLFGVRTMEEVFDQRATKALHILIEAVAGMGLLGLVLAMVGLYGLMSYSVTLRAREIGIRMAIGAGHVSVLGMVLKQGMALAGVGIIIGLLLCAMASRATAAAFSVGSFNLTLVALVATALVLVAALGAYVPARRASLLDPNTVLRQE
jgi:hypothetical protein